MLFNVGDRVVYPPQGAGIIREIVERDVLGTTRQYFRIDFVLGDMAVLVPLDKSNDVGLRKAIGAAEIPLIRTALNEGDAAMPESWQARNRLQKTIIEKGYAHEIAHLIGALAKREVERGLAATELELYHDARQFLAAEITLALDLPWNDCTANLVDQVQDGTVG